MTRAVLDANVFVAAAINPGGTPAGCLLAFADGRYDLVVSPRLLGELRAVLHREKFRAFLTLDQADRLIEALARDAIAIADPADPAAVSRDSGDDYLLALANAAEAPVLVTGDLDLLELEVPGVKIVTPRAFLELLPR